MFDVKLGYLKFRKDEISFMTKTGPAEVGVRRRKGEIATPTPGFGSIKSKPCSIKKPYNY